MSRTPSSDAARPSFGTEVPDSVDTIVLVDVDGVLNVGAREDKGTAPLLLNTANCEHAFRLLRDGALGPNSTCDLNTRRSVERLVSMWYRKLPEEGAKTYGGLMCQAPSMFSPVLVDRLAQILRLAGGRRAAVLSSSWRKPSYAKRVKELEAAISARLGEEFAFAAATPGDDEHCAADRLRCIGSFIEALADSRARRGAARSTPLRILILEDFFISAPEDWATFGCPIDSVRAAEAFLRGRAPDLDLSVKIVHTYDAWTTPSGLRVSVGSGLTARAMRQATEYLDPRARCSFIGRQMLKVCMPSKTAPTAELPLAEHRHADTSPAWGDQHSAAHAGPRLWHLLATWPWLLIGSSPSSPCRTPENANADDMATPLHCK
mmetsp:Transcript_24510/g.70361  ORF Transcript_24510/g.70361 Transcript_24510/m.70361 type:complete len:377 (-) Transcript_24510:78-1208(-)